MPKLWEEQQVFKNKSFNRGLLFKSPVHRGSPLHLDTSTFILGKALLCVYTFCMSVITNISFRLKSLEPFVRHFMGQKFLDMLEVQKKEDVTSVMGKS
jgi:hypothetical protein